jgi:hypothetical protein
MERREANAYPLLGYHLLTNPGQPTIAAIAFETVDGPFLFAATREILEELAEAFTRHAASMPRKTDQN